MKQNKRFSPPMIGGSSLLVIFAILCLTVFTLLALSTVQADNRLSEASIEAVTNYYQADYEAEKILADLRAGEIPESVHVEDNIYSYSCIISDTLTLEVEVSFLEGQWTVLRWQAVSSMQ